MNGEALLLVIAGALCHALWNAQAKQAAGGLPFVWLFGLFSLAFTLPIAAPVLLRDASGLNGLAWAGIVASAIIHLAYSLILQKGYQVSDFTLVYPLARGSGPLFAVLGAILWLGEMPAPAGWAGIATLLLGVFLIGGGRRLLAGGRALHSGVFWGGLTGLSIAAYTLVDGWAIKALGITPLLYYVLVLALRTLILAPFALRRPARLQRQWQDNRRRIVVVGALSPLAYLLVLEAMRQAPLSYVAPVREVSMLFGLLLGAHLLKERPDTARLTGCGLMVLGSLLLIRA